MASAHSIPSIEERFEFTSGAKRNLIIGGAIGAALVIVGIYFAANGGGGHHEAEAAHGAVNAITGHASHEAAGHATEEHHVSWLTRIWANLWINAVYFTGISVVGMFFISYNYLAQAGWSAVFKRVPEAMPAYNAHRVFLRRT
jgi:hypothetical protein